MSKERPWMKYVAATFVLVALAFLASAIFSLIDYLSKPIVHRPIGFTLYGGHAWEISHKQKIITSSVLTIVLRSSGGPMEVEIVVDGATLCCKDRTFEVELKRSLDPGEHAISVRVANLGPRPISVEGELKIERRIW